MTAAEYETVTVTGVHPYGMFDTVILFDAVDVNGLGMTVAIGHRVAMDWVRALAEGWWDGEVDVEDWQIMGRSHPSILDGEEPRRSSAEREADRAAGRES